ncbi:MAG: hypothetical protein WKG00_38195, partial [Polyangiaceae bacterium]
ESVFERNFLAIGRSGGLARRRRRIRRAPGRGRQRRGAGSVARRPAGGQRRSVEREHQREHQHEHQHEHEHEHEHIARAAAPSFRFARRRSASVERPGGKADAAASARRVDPAGRRGGQASFHRGRTGRRLPHPGCAGHLAHRTRMPLAFCDVRKASQPSRGLRLALLAALLGGWCCPAPARAEGDPQRCVTLYESAQKARLDGKLLIAREQLRGCVAEACPAIVRRDCSEWLHEVEQALPTVIVGARDAAGVDRGDVSVYVDGRLLADRLTGQTLPIDPGEHTLRFEHAGSPPVVQRIIVNAGEKNRLLRVSFTAAGAGKAAGAASSASPPWLAIALAGAGTVAVGIGAAVDASASSDLGALHDGCAPGCQQADVDDIKARMTVGDALLVGGIAAVGVAAVLWLTRGADADAAPAPAAKVGRLPPAPHAWQWRF